MHFSPGRNLTEHRVPKAQAFAPAAAVGTGLVMLCGDLVCDSERAVDRVTSSIAITVLPRDIAWIGVHIVEIGSAKPSASSRPNTATRNCSAIEGQRR